MQLTRAFLRIFISQGAWILPALFSILKDLRALAEKAITMHIFRKQLSHVFFLISGWWCQVPTRRYFCQCNGRCSTTLQQSLHRLHHGSVCYLLVVILLSLCASSNTGSETRKWGIYHVVGLIFKCYFSVCKPYIWTSRNLKIPYYLGQPDCSLSQHHPCP